VPLLSDIDAHEVGILRSGSAACEHGSQALEEVVDRGLIAVHTSLFDGDLDGVPSGEQLANADTRLSQKLQSGRRRPNSLACRAAVIPVQPNFELLVEDNECVPDQLYYPVGH
jgi:hypothetical protein